MIGFSERAPGQEHERGGYWNEYYASATSLDQVPSQFAVFVFGELALKAGLIVDVGCGLGRDAFFFARHGVRVLGIDASSAAVERCTEFSRKVGLNADFLSMSIADEGLLRAVKERCATAADQKVIVYARFFLHAITPEEESKFLSVCADLCADAGWLALEFRTTRDAALTKVTPAHYRRYVDPLKLVEAASAFGFKSEYFVEGFGFAKYKEDDAYVARLLLAKK